MGKSSFFGETTTAVQGIVTGSWVSEFEHDGQVSYCLQTEVYDSWHVHYFHVYTLVPAKRIEVGRFVLIHPLGKKRQADPIFDTEAIFNETSFGIEHNPFDFLPARTKEQQKSKGVLVWSYSHLQAELKEVVLRVIQLRPDLFVSSLATPGLLQIISETSEKHSKRVPLRMASEDDEVSMESQPMHFAPIAAFLQMFCKANRNFCTGWPQGVRVSFSGFWQFSNLRPGDERLLANAQELLHSVGQILEEHGFQKAPDFIRVNEKYFLMAALERYREC
ncbi:conserved hypothetical protein [Limnobacter sp. 130]|uniref:hypothetical protein n=1 Tax=Limnobacter sp. 130 TaxID=2653147 RepID=UPI0012F2E303|nr:hypothetical protein [Limnobacter sp. 130]VWX34131.1 conserved hypothetical protein [Limnobacter sp. 130]